MTGALPDHGPSGPGANQTLFKKTKGDTPLRAVESRHAWQRSGEDSAGGTGEADGADGRAVDAVMDGAGMVPD